MRKHIRMTAVILAVLVLLLAVPAFAQESYTPVNGDKTTVQISKTLDLGDAVYGPSHTVTITTTYVGNQLTGSAHAATGTVPAITLNFGTTDTEKTSKLDFTGVSFPGPGIYRFLVQETAISADSVTAAEGSYTSYYLDIYVINVTSTSGDSALQISNYVASTVTGLDSENPSVTPKTSDKQLLEFENEYTAFKLDVEKNVTGNQGDKSREFTVTVTFAEGQAGDKYSVKHVTGTPKVNGTAITAGNPVDIDANSSVVLKLKDTDRVEFYGIPEGVTYTVVETESGQAGYTTTGEVTTATPIDGEDAVVVIVNNRQGTIPTGLFLNYKPYWIMGIVAVVLLGVFVIRRRKHSHEGI